MNVSGKRRQRLGGKRAGHPPDRLSQRRAELAQPVYLACPAGHSGGEPDDRLASRGCRVTGIDPAVEGVEIARRSFPNVAFHLGTAYDDLAGTYGTFPIVISLEVIEHCFSIKAYLETMFRLIEPGGRRV